MLHIIIASDSEVRKKERARTIGESIPLALDDTLVTLEELTAYVYPSLFSTERPVVHARFLCEGNTDLLTKELIVLLVESPTVFILEENGLSAPVKKLFEKHGAHIFEHIQKKKPSENTIFKVTDALTLSSKKEKWIAYRNAVAEHAPEALIGILYWKLRQLIEKTKDASQYKKMYTALITAHKTSWQKGYSLELAIEKVILTL